MEYRNDKQGLKVKHKAELLGIKAVTLSKVFKRSRKRVYDAFNGEAPELLKKIETYLAKREQKSTITTTN